jgi:hypothetical protein
MMHVLAALMARTMVRGDIRQVVAAGGGNSPARRR